MYNYHTFNYTSRYTGYNIILISYPVYLEVYRNLHNLLRIEVLEANRVAEYRSYEEAKAFLKPLRITSQRRFLHLYELDIIPADIPKKPFSHYLKHESWISFPDF